MPACANCGFAAEPAARFCPQCGTEFVAARSREQRKTVTVLFCDLTGSTALGETLDPERLRALLARYFERMSAIVERHGGSVEKFIGDAVMAVFGVPTLHEDDALRAVRAAAEMRDAIPELGLQGRIGVMTGEVVSGTAERLATGDAVNVAARLEQAAQPGEVLIGQPTLELVRDAVEVGPAQPLELKGKSKPVPAYRLTSLHDAPERQHAARFVGRERELAALRDTWDRVLAEERCELVTVIGDAGVGKTRLVAEALASIDATALHGRCLPYGEGITYWPVLEVLRQLDSLPPDPVAAAAIRSLLGETTAPTSAEEIAWAVRKTLEHAARQRPLVVVFDDIQWGEQTFRDLLEHVALLSSGAPILLVCTARPELSERHPDWPVRLRLEPLAEPEVSQLLAERIAPELGTRIAHAAGGNPLFIEEMLAMAGQADGEVRVPPSLQALLAARLDQLEAAERSVLERGAVEGEVFHRGAVQALAPAETQITPRLAALVRKELIRPDQAQLAGEDGFRFRHLLIRDAAYEALPKAIRADLHQRFAAWLLPHASDLVEADEILGYHLEQAHRYRAELGLPDDPTLAASARSRLTAGGRRALLRQDFSAATNLLGRAVALLVAGARDVPLELDLLGALYDAGDLTGAQRLGHSVAERAAAAGDRVGELCALLEEGSVATAASPEGATERLAALAEQSLPVFEAANDDLALSTAYRALGYVANMRGRMDQRLEAGERALIHLRRAGIQYREDRLVYSMAFALVNGSTPVSKVLEWLDEQDVRSPNQPLLREARGWSLANLGHFDEARAILSGLRAELADRGAMLRLGDMMSQTSVEVELLAGDPAAGVEFGEAGCRLLEQIGEKSYLSTSAGMLAQALYRLDRLDEADAWASRSAELGASDDVVTQVLWRRAKAKVLARRGELGKAEQLARDAVSRSEETDMLNPQGDAYTDLAEVLSLATRAQEAAHAQEQALACYERKGNLVSAERARSRLTELRVGL